LAYISWRGAPVFGCGDRFQSRRHSRYSSLTSSIEGSSVWLAAMNSMLAFESCRLAVTFWPVKCQCFERCFRWNRPNADSIVFEFPLYGCTACDIRAIFRRKSPLSSFLCPPWLSYRTSYGLAPANATAFLNASYCSAKPSDRPKAQPKKHSLYASITS